MKPILITQSDTSDRTGAGMGSTEGVRRVTGGEPMSGDRKILHRLPSGPEVVEKKRRRMFTAKYKLNILSEADLCAEPG